MRWKSLWEQALTNGSTGIRGRGRVEEGEDLGDPCSPVGLVVLGDGSSGVELARGIGF